MKYRIPPPPAGLELSRVPTLKGKPEAHAWITQKLGVAITLNAVVTAANKREIPRTVIKGALHFSTQDLYDWIMTDVVEQTTEPSTGA